MKELWAKDITDDYSMWGRVGMVGRLGKIGIINDENDVVRFVEIRKLIFEIVTTSEVNEDLYEVRQVLET